MENTIVAISTAMGNGGIGIVRMSGEKSFEILDKIFRPKNNDHFIKGYQIKYGNIIVLWRVKNTIWMKLWKRLKRRIKS